MWNFTIESLNLAFISVGSHFALLALTAIKWPAFFESFRSLLKPTDGRFQNQLHLLNDDWIIYKKVRRTFQYGLATILLVLNSISHL